MKKIFVAVPPKYGLDDDGVEYDERKSRLIAIASNIPILS